MTTPPPPSPALASEASSTAPARDLNVEASLLKDFLRGIAYVPPTINVTNEQLEAAMRAEMEARSLQCDQLERTIHLAASLIELAYHEWDFAEKKKMALFHWYLLYVDDMGSKDKIPLRMFQQRFLTGQPQMDPVLNALVEVLVDLWKRYEPLCANSIISSVFEFITFNCIEREVEALPLIRGAQRFPGFLRDRTGLSPAYAFMIFPQAGNPNILEYIQALPDMYFWMAVTNDLLSFHKEELAGEKANYVHTRAYMENKAPLQVLTEIVHDLSSSQSVIHEALAHSPEALRAWKVYERGYIAWHLSQERYKLKDLGF